MVVPKANAQTDTIKSTKRIDIYSAGVHLRAASAYVVEYGIMAMPHVEFRMGGGSQKFAGNLYQYDKSTTSGGYFAVGITLHSRDFVNRKVNAQGQQKRKRLTACLSYNYGGGVLDFYGEKTFKGSSFGDKTFSYELKKLSYRYTDVRFGIEWFWHDLVRFDFYPLVFTNYYAKSKPAFAPPFVPGIGIDWGGFNAGFGINLILNRERKQT